MLLSEEGPCRPGRAGLAGGCAWLNNAATSPGVLMPNPRNPLIILGEEVILQMYFN